MAPCGALDPPHAKDSRTHAPIAPVLIATALQGTVAPLPLRAFREAERLLGPEVASLGPSVARPVRLSGRLHPEERGDERGPRRGAGPVAERPPLGIAPLRFGRGPVAVAAGVDDEM